MSIILDGTNGITTPDVDSTNDSTINGVTVGRGAGSVSTNTAVGASALDANTTGASNVALGTDALGANTTASNNTAVGYQAGYTGTTATQNTAIGYQALLSATTSSVNTAVGYQAAYNLTTGGFNTMIGRSAGANTTTGVKNTFIGGYNGSTGAAGSDITSGSANTILGAYTGNQGNLDIRTSNNNIVLSDGDGNPRAYWDGSQYWSFGSSLRLRIANSFIGDAPGPLGNDAGIAFGNSNLYSADGSGNLHDNIMSLGSGSYRWATIYAGTGTINTSDANSKQQIRDLDAAEKAVAIRIKGLIKTFKFNDSVAKKGADARIHIGVIAQEVQAAFVAEGLDASRYGLFCSDTWYEVDGQGVDENKRPYSADTPNAVEKTRLGIRYEELLAFVIAAI